MQAVHRQIDHQSEVVLQAAKVAGQELFQRRVLQQVVGALEGILPVLGQVQHQDRLIDLHPLHALGRQAPEDLGIHRQQPFEQFQLVEGLALDLAQPQVSQRADQHRLDLMAEAVGLIDLLKQLLPAQLEFLLGTELRDQVVIVAVEPLG